MWVLQKLKYFLKNFRQMLQGIYERVKEFEFRSGSDHVTQVMKVDQNIIGKDKPVYFFLLIIKYLNIEIS